MRLAAAALVVLLPLAAGSCASGPDPDVPGAPVPPPVEDVILRFDSPAALGDWVVTGGEWRIADGRLVGRSLDPTGTANEYAVYATPFAEIERVAIRGGLDASAKDNFRVAVGAVGVILNWEVRPENVVHHGYRAARHFGPCALVPGQESEIVIEQRGRRVRLVVDDRLLWEDDGSLSGTITLSAAFRTTMTVREVSIRGRPVHGLRVQGPSAPAP